MKETGRFFVGISLNQQIKDQIHKIQTKLRKYDCQVKWVDLDNCHLTLKFLGQVAYKNLDDIHQALETLIKKYKSFSFELTSPGAFPNIKRPKILWVGVRENGDQLNKLAEDMEENFFRMGFEKEKRGFHPHITIGRIKSLKNIEKISSYLQHGQGNFALKEDVSEIIFYESKLNSGEPLYKIVRAYSLTG